ncbi:MAG: endonuclease/exonuclease/phosphatase family protein [Planctomycetes bacterium]|nr:endonuclease/exonuclease/phosphatase family protein [Planctomycetota bacterium]
MRLRPTNLVALLALPAFPPALAPFVAGLHWTIDLLACFAVQAMGALLLAAAVLFAARRWRLALLCLAGGLLAAAAVVPDWCTGPAAPAAGPTLRLLSLNLLRGNEANAAAAVATVRASEADVVFCSEATPGWLAGLQPLLADDPHHHRAADPGYYGTLLLSRLPLVDARSLPLGVDWAPAVRAVVRAPAGDVGLLAVHTPRPGGRERGRNRDLALAAIPAALRGLPPQRVVFGDFNITPWNHAFGRLVADAELEPASARAFRATWPAALPWPLRVPIDHVLLGGGMQLVRCTVGASFGSDHLPLAAELRWPAR